MAPVYSSQVWTHSLSKPIFVLFLRPFTTLTIMYIFFPRIDFSTSNVFFFSKSILCVFYVKCLYHSQNRNQYVLCAHFSIFNKSTSIHLQTRHKKPYVPYILEANIIRYRKYVSGFKT